MIVSVATAHAGGIRYYIIMPENSIVDDDTVVLLQIMTSPLIETFSLALASSSCKLYS